MKKSKTLIPLIFSIIGFFIPIYSAGTNESWYNLVAKSFEFCNKFIGGIYDNWAILILIALPILLIPILLFLGIFHFVKNEFKQSSLFFFIGTFLITFVHLMLYLNCRIVGNNKIIENSWESLFFYFSKYNIGFWFYIYPVLVWWGWYAINQENKDSSFAEYFKFAVKPLKWIGGIVIGLLILSILYIGLGAINDSKGNYTVNAECDKCPNNAKIKLVSIDVGFIEHKIIIEIENTGSESLRFVPKEDLGKLFVLWQAFPKDFPFDMAKEVTIVNSSIFENSFIIPVTETKKIELQVKNTYITKNQTFSLIGKHEDSSDSLIWKIPNITLK
jgi:hypothetical protein